MKENPGSDDFVETAKIESSNAKDPALIAAGHEHKPGQTLAAETKNESTN